MDSTAPITRQDILRQPEALLGLLGRHDELRRLIASAGFDGSASRLYAFGCGDGFFAAQAASFAFVHQGIHDYRGVSSLEFLQCHAPFADPRCLLAPVSMSGNVDRTVEGLQAGIARGATALAITNSTTGLLARRSQHAFQLGLQESASFLAGTITYTASVLALFLLAIESAELAGLDGRRRSLDELADMVGAIGGSLADLEAQTAAVVSALPPASRIYFLAGGSGFASARYAACKFVELTGTHAIPQDTEEFAHSNFWQFQRSDLVFVLHDPGETEPVSSRAAALLREFGARVVEIAQGDPSRRDPDVIRIVNPCGQWSPLALSFPLQFIAYHWSLKDGLNPDTRSHLRNDEVRFTINRKLSRRSLVG